MICCNSDELSHKVEKGDFGIVVMKEDLTEENFARNIPKLHTTGLREASDIIESLVSDIDHKFENTKNATWM